MKSCFIFLLAIFCSNFVSAEVFCGKLKVGSFNSNPSIQYLLVSSTGDISELDFGGVASSQQEIDVLLLKGSIANFLVDGQNYCFGGKASQVASYPAISFNCVEVGVTSNMCN